MRFLKYRSTRALIIIMSALVVIGLAVATLYYRHYNARNDPRIVEARKMYEQYNALAQQNDFINVFLLLDSIQSIYTGIPHYKDSYEVGVLYNNRSAAFLTIALHKEQLSFSSMDPFFLELSSDSLLDLAEMNLKNGIGIYETWLETFESQSKEIIKKRLEKDFYIGLEDYSMKEIEQFAMHRIKEIETAQLETKRRLSVSYTNFGIIHRHRENYAEAISCYQKALILWDRNLQAENNLNILLGRPQRKRTLIEKLFPPDRKN